MSDIITVRRTSEGIRVEIKIPQNDGTNLNMQLATSPMAWGIILHDIAKNVAQMFETYAVVGDSESPADYETVLEEIERGFATEKSCPTDTPRPPRPD
jgi:hypothetical protein